MIQFEKFTLDNGLRFIFHRDTSTPMVAMNILYDVGSRDEDPDRTGFAHLFEHLMFGGSVNIPRYDEPLQRAGGENNAFTNSDITNYYLTLPAENMETAFWLESDRMLDLAFTEKSIEVQRQVVVEEFRQNYLNQPYGDVWMLLKPLAYTVHPYQWNTIGKTPDHITQASSAEVKSFYSRHYNPENAIIALTGNADYNKVRQMAVKWFGPIAKKNGYIRNLPVEPPQQEKRLLEVSRDVPVSALYKAWHMCARSNDDFYAADLISDLLGSGNSSRLHQSLIRKQKLFSEINAFITGDIDPGLFVVSGKLLPGVDPAKAEKALNEQINELKQEKLRAIELRKVKNKVLSAIAFSNISVLNKAMNLAYNEHLGQIELINQLEHKYRGVSLEDINKVSNALFNDENSSVLYYLSK
jgi:zinc protease